MNPTPTTYHALPEAFGKLKPETRHVTLEASAGTGKTYTLERLLVELIARGVATIDQILAVTFTERAAAELRQRMRSMLVKLLQEQGSNEPPIGPYLAVDPAARRRLEQALVDFDRAPIQTIHGFCNQVLREYAFHRCGPFDVELKDAGEVFGRAFVEVLTHELAREPAPRALLARWVAERSVDSLRELLSSTFGSAGLRVPEPSPEKSALRMGRMAELLTDHYTEIMQALHSRVYKLVGIKEFVVDLAITAVQACVTRGLLWGWDWARESISGLMLSSVGNHLAGGGGFCTKGPIKGAAKQHPTATTVYDLFNALSLATDKYQKGNASPWDDANYPFVLDGMLREVGAALADNEIYAEVRAIFVTAMQGSSKAKPALALAVLRAFTQVWTTNPILGVGLFQAWFLEEPLLSCMMGKSDGRGAPSRQAAHDLMRLPRLLRRELEKSTTTRPALEFFDLLADQLRDTDHLEGYVVRDFLPAVETERSARTALTGSYTFHDMLQQVEAALDDPQHGPALIARLRQRYEVALVDEFQDTDELQWGILQRVFAGDGEGERLVVVGDPKQAIYTFRGGDVFTYQKAQAELAQAAAVPIQLAQNFRSTPRLLEVFDAIFDDETENRLLTGDIRTSKVTPGRQNLRFVDKDGKDLPAMRVLQLNSSTGAAPTKPQLRAALGRTLGQLIHELLQPETGAYLVDNGAAPSDENRVRAKDIYVLTATNHEARLAGRYLREARVPYAFYKQDGLMQTDEAADVRDVLAAILDPNDRAARAKAWMTPFFGLTLGELYRLDDVPEEHSLMRRLRSWSTLAEKRLYEQLFKSMMERSGMLRREVFFGPSERALTNYLHLFELLLDELSVARHALPELLRCLNALITGQQSPVGVDGNVQRLETEVASVQIMTIHKSKGLEAAIVFLYGGLSDPKNKPPCVYHDARGRRLVSSVSPEELGDGGLFAAETAEEQQRLTYVALTRAAGQLVVPKGGRSVALDGLLGALDTRLEVILKAGTLVGSGHVERADVDVFANAAITLAPPPNLAISWHPSEPAEAVLPDYAELKSSKRHVDSYSSFGRRRPPLSILDDPQSDAEVIDGLPAEVPVESLLPRGAHMGLALHELLEKAELERVAEAADGSAWLAQEGARDFVERVLRRHHVRATDPLVQETARVVHATLTTPLPGRDGPVAPIVSCDHVVPEVPFVFPTPLEGHPFLLPNLDGDGNPVPLEIGRGYVKGTIDLLFADQGLVYFADWKSDLLADYGAATMRAHVREHYGWQELFYTLAVVKMLGIREPATYESRFGGRLYVFLRGVRAGTSVTPGVDFFRPSWQRLAKYEERIRTTASASADESDDDTLAGDA